MKKYQHWTVDEWIRFICSEETKINGVEPGGRLTLVLGIEKGKAVLYNYIINVKVWR